MEEGKIKLSSDEFIRALQTGKATDTNNVEHDFQSNEPLPGVYDIRNVDVREAKLYDIKTDKTIFLTNCNFGDTIFLSCEFTELLGIHGCNFEHHFALSRSTFNHVDFNDNSLYSFFSTFSTISSFKLKSCIIEKDFSIYGNCSVNSLHISNCHLTNNLKLYDCFEKCKIDNCQFTILQIPNIKEKATLKISNSAFERIETGHDFSNLGYMQCNNLQPSNDAEIIIKNAVMGKWDIVNCDFSNTKLTVYSSKITDTFYTNTKFPQRLTPPSDVTDKVQAHDILRDGYNQRKTIAQKQNDRRMFLHYQSEELHSYKATLKLTKDWPTVFQLWAMLMSNDYGNKWTWGVLFTLFFNTIFVMIAFSDRVFSLTWEGLGRLFSGFLSSLFSLITVPKYFETTWEINWFYVSRLIIAFGIYQTIAAFRKFGKSE